METLTAFPESIKVQCHNEKHHKTLEIKGIACIGRKECGHSGVIGIGSFILSLRKAPMDSYHDSFHMTICVESRPALNHDSGVIDIKGCTFKIKGCCD